MQFEWQAVPRSRTGDAECSVAETSSGARQQSINQWLIERWTDRRVCHRWNMSFMLMSRVRGQKHQSKCSKQNMLIEKQQTYQYLACHHVNSRWYDYYQLQSLSQQKCHLHTRQMFTCCKQPHSYISDYLHWQLNTENIKHLIICAHCSVKVYKVCPFSGTWEQFQLHALLFIFDNRNWTWVCNGTISSRTDQVWWKSQFWATMVTDTARRPPATDRTDYNTLCRYA